MMDRCVRAREEMQRVVMAFNGLPCEQADRERLQSSREKFSRHARQVLKYFFDRDHGPSMSVAQDELHAQEYEVVLMVHRLWYMQASTDEEFAQLAAKWHSESDWLSFWHQQTEEQADASNEGLQAPATGSMSP